ncbi:unnamed protein product [Pleuronectes platessa]|uniref:Uncharacterized protein n=1 Tax=Pleuronectes platessa TaxID=8262 RepID=A0A9N7Z3T2_PLEPL|nr:unnamed protein product [Pleuronectes platessa]
MCADLTGRQCDLAVQMSSKALPLPCACVRKRQEWEAPQEPAGSIFPRRLGATRKVLRKYTCKRVQSEPRIGISAKFVFCIFLSSASQQFAHFAQRHTGTVLCQEHNDGLVHGQSGHGLRALEATGAAVAQEPFGLWTVPSPHPHPKDRTIPSPPPPHTYITNQPTPLPPDNKSYY